MKGFIEVNENGNRLLIPVRSIKGVVENQEGKALIATDSDETIFSTIIPEEKYNEIVDKLILAG